MWPAVMCVLRSGGDFEPAHVAHLHAGVRRWWPSGEPLRFVVLTDMDTQHLSKEIEVRRLRWSWPGWWSKMEMFLGEHDDLGDVLTFDLDTLIVGPLLRIAAHASQLTLLSDFNHPHRAESGVMALPVHWRPLVAAAWLESPRGVMERYYGDGGFLHDVLGRYAQRWQTVVPRQIVSYKRDVRRTSEIVAGTRVICFHGSPRPWETSLWTTEAR